MLERAIEQFRLAGDAAGVHGSVLGLGDLALARGDARAALARYLEAQPSVLRDGSVLDLEYACAGIAAVAALEGRRDAAARLWGVVARLDDEAERKMEPDDRARFEREALGDLDEGALRAGRALGDEQAVELLRAVSEELA